MNKQKPILSDHIRQGKLFKPPLSQIGVLQETSWKETTMPELLWLGLVLQEHGLRKSIELTLSLAREAEAYRAESKALCFAFTSSYGILSDGQKANIRGILAERGELNPLCTALALMKELYPDCPLNFIHADDSYSNTVVSSGLEIFKGFLGTLYNKRDRVPVLMQAQAVYIMGALGRLVVQRGSALGDLNALVSYPKTEESKIVGATVCAMCNWFSGMTLSAFDSGWAQYFWERNFEMDPCEYSLPYEL